MLCDRARCGDPLASGSITVVLTIPPPPLPTVCFLSGVLPGTLPAMFSGDGGSEDNAKTIGLVVIMVCAGVMALGLAFVAPCARRMAAMEIDSLSLHIDSQNLVIRRGKPMCCPVRSFMYARLDACPFDFILRRG